MFDRSDSRVLLKVSCELVSKYGVKSAHLFVAAFRATSTWSVSLYIPQFSVKLGLHPVNSFETPQDPTTFLRGYKVSV